MPMPTKYRPEMCRLAYKACLLGATDKQLAEILEIHETNLNEWKKRHPDFAAALRKGKDEADAAVAQSLYHRARGYRHIAFKMFQSDGKVITKRYVEHFPPDTTACIFWLKNRRPDVWRDRHELTGANGGPVEHRVEEMPDVEAARHVAFAMAEGAEAVKRAQRTGNQAAKTEKV